MHLYLLLGLDSEQLENPDQVLPVYNKYIQYFRSLYGVLFQCEKY